MQKILGCLLLSTVSIAGTIANAGAAEPFLIPWSESVPYPTAAEIPFPQGIYHSIVHDGDTDPDYKFLHEAASHSKFAAGKLSTGQRYIIYNLPHFERDEKGRIAVEGMKRGRQTLVIAVANPGEKAFSHIWKVSDVSQSTHQKMSCYPCAVEHDGMLYVTYTGQHKSRNCGFTAIPVASLAR